MDIEDFACLLCGELNIFLEQAPRMRNRKVNRPKALRRDVQSCTRYIPNLVMSL
jgi:hypothetical protein